MAPNVAIKTAPAQTRIVPIREYLVNASPRIRVAKMVLKTSPDYHQALTSVRDNTHTPEESEGSTHSLKS